jgi:hypothetical protein
MMEVEVTGGALLAMSAYISIWVLLVAVTTGHKGIRVATVPIVTRVRVCNLALAGVQFDRENACLY